MAPEVRRTDAKAVREARDSVAYQLYKKGAAISEIMRRTGKSYTYVKNTIDLGNSMQIRGDV